MYSEDFELKKFQIANGVLQNPPPIAPMKMIVARVSKSLFGAPNDTPNTGKKKVRNEIGINCVSLGLKLPIFCEIFCAANADTKIIPRKETMAAPKEGGSSPIPSRSTATNVPNVAPVPAPTTNVFFQFTWYHLVPE